MPRDSSSDRMPAEMRGAEVAGWCASAAVRRWLGELAQRMRSRATLTALREASFWAREGPRLDSLLQTIQLGAPGEGPLTDPAAPPVPRGEPLPRVVHWNILKGIAYEEIAAALTMHPDLAGAAVVLLNEVDVGMARSGNRHIAAELGARLGRYWSFLPNYFELTKGPGEEARVAGENAIGLHGVAVLTHDRPRALQACVLPECFDMFAFDEKRYGGRAALLVELPGPWVVVSVHLEVRSSPACRARQMRALLAGLTAFLRARALPDETPVLLGGDLNTHTFPRGTLRHALRGYLRLRLTSPHRLHAELMEPWRGGREPLFAALRKAAFQWEDLNDRQPTASAQLDAIEDWRHLPPTCRAAAGALLGRRRQEIPLRLDWFVARGRGARGGSRDPRTITGLCCDSRPSDHAPIVLEMDR